MSDNPQADLCNGIEYLKRTAKQVQNAAYSHGLADGGQSWTAQSKEDMRSRLKLGELLQALDNLPTLYPRGDVVAACVCGGWPGGKCFRCPQTPTFTAADFAAVAAEAGIPDEPFKVALLLLAERKRPNV